jgi:hypothetical protein
MRARVVSARGNTARSPDRSSVETGTVARSVGKALVPRPALAAEPRLLLLGLVHFDAALIHDRILSQLEVS